MNRNRSIVKFRLRVYSLRVQGRKNLSSSHFELLITRKACKSCKTACSKSETNFYKHVVHTVYVCERYFTGRGKIRDCLKMSGGPSTGVCILVQQASGVRKAKRTGKSQKVPYIKKGELLFEIPLKDRVKQEADKPPHNYALLRDPEVTLYDNGINVVPLIGPEADYLEGVKDPHTRYLEHRKEDRLKWIMDLRIGEMVYFKLERDKSSKVPLTTQGRIKWYGVMDGEIGVNFGIEITVSKIDCIQVS